MKIFSGTDHSLYGAATNKISYQDPLSAEWLSERLNDLLKANVNRELVVVCIGTDRSTGDSLGPLVGTQLRKSGLDHVPVYGTLEEPVHAMNLSEMSQEIDSKFDSPFIVAIDACLGQVSSIGNIQIGVGPVKPGAGVNKDLPPVGDIHITGIVNVGGFMEYFVLQNTRLNLVMKMADIIALSLLKSLTQWRRFSPGATRWRID